MNNESSTLTKEETKDLVDNCRDKCLNSFKEMFAEIDAKLPEGRERNAFKYLLRGRVANYLWTIAYPQAMDIILEVQKDER